MKNERGPEPQVTNVREAILPVLTFSTVCTSAESPAQITSTIVYFDDLSAKAKQD
jgi:hypothetical protein